jgi:hypothetical protein
MGLFALVARFCGCGDHTIRGEIGDPDIYVARDSSEVNLGLTPWVIGILAGSLTSACIRFLPRNVLQASGSFRFARHDAPALGIVRTR